jgi:uncharacterized protein YdaT
MNDVFQKGLETTDNVLDDAYLEANPAPIATEATE